MGLLSQRIRAHRRQRQYQAMLHVIRGRRAARLTFSYPDEGHLLHVRIERGEVEVAETPADAFRQAVRA